MIQNPQMLPGVGVPLLGKKYQTIMACNMHPLSRGSVHITSTDPLVQPAIDPAYVQNPIDLAVLVRAVRFVRKLTATAPLCDTIVDEYSPGPNVQTDEELKEFVKATLQPVWHPVGSAAMLPKECGGVVDPRLTVYGTRNLRVVRFWGLPEAHVLACSFFPQVDASILPFVELSLLFFREIF